MKEGSSGTTLNHRASRSAETFCNEAQTLCYYHFKEFIYSFLFQQLAKEFELVSPDRHLTSHEAIFVLNVIVLSLSHFKLHLWHSCR